MSPTRRTLPVLAFALFALVLSGCSDKALQTVAKGSADIAAANAALGSTLMTAQANGGLTVDQARPILQITLQIAQADIQVNQAIRGVNSLTPTQKTQILAIIQPLMTAVNGAVSTGTIPINNPTLKTSILASLTTIQAALATVAAVL